MSKPKWDWSRLDEPSPWVSSGPSYLDLKTAQSRPAKPKRLPKHEPWMNRWALWAFHGVRHLATHAAPVGNGVIATLACGGASNFGIVADTWWSLRVVDSDKMCRRCTAILKAAGKNGPIKRSG